MKCLVPPVVGFPKGRSAIHIARSFGIRRKNFSSPDFWARGYYVSTPGQDEEEVRSYVHEREEEDRYLHQLELYYE